MGRYAFFNTGVEYKFVFAKQCSSDMMKFGGTANNGRYEDESMNSWTKEDIPKIKIELDQYEEAYGLEKLETIISKFENNTKGTYELKNYLFDKSNIYTYILGCIIYHQLQYVDVLEVNYEL
jgi:hypothetical protein